VRSRSRSDVADDAEEHQRGRGEEKPHERDHAFAPDAHQVGRGQQRRDQA